MKNLTKEFKHIEGLTDKRIVQKSFYDPTIEHAMEYAQMVREEGTSFERLYIKDGEIYFGNKFECEDMIVGIVNNEDYDRFYRIVFDSNNTKWITKYVIMDDNHMEVSDTFSDINKINELDESDKVKEVLRRMFITLGEPCEEVNKMENIIKRFKHIEGLTDKRIIQTPRCCENLETEAKEYADRIRNNKTTLELLYMKDGEIVFGDNKEFDDMIVCFISPSIYDYYYMIHSDENGIKSLAKSVKGIKGVEEVGDLETLDESEIVKEVLRRMLLTIGK